MIYRMWLASAGREFVALAPLSRDLGVPEAILRDNVIWGFSGAIQFQEPRITISPNPSDYEWLDDGGAVRIVPKWNAVTVASYMGEEAA